MQSPLRDHVEARRRQRRREIDRHIDQQGVPRKRRSFAPGRRVHQDTEKKEEEIRVIRGEMRGGFELDEQRQIRPPNLRQQVHARLDRTLRPAMLLRLEAVHIHGQLGRRHQVREENKPPALELRPVAQVQILRQRVMLPTAGIRDARPPPQPGRPVEIEEPPRPAPRRLLQQQMPIEEHRLHPRQHRIRAIQMPPARLDHPHLGVGEKVDRLEQHIRRRHEVGVQNQHELSRATGHPGLQRPRLEPRPIRPVDQLNVQAARL